MSYKTVELFKSAKESILKNKLIFIEDIIAFLPCAKPTFYEHFPTESDSYKELFSLLEKNRVDLKVNMRHKWFKSNAPALQMGLYKLLSTEDELRKLAMTVQAHEGEMNITWVENKNYGPKPETESSD